MLRRGGLEESPSEKSFDNLHETNLPPHISSLYLEMELKNDIESLDLERLKPFPLPKELEALPPTALEEFCSLYELIQGYIKGLPAAKTFNREIEENLDWQIRSLNEVIELLDDYKNTGEVIREKISQLLALYEEFVNLETSQYQLLTTNFDREVLTGKFKKAVADKENASEEMQEKVSLAALSGDEKYFTESLKEFRASRKDYHLLKEKLNRWNEERVSGFI